MISFYCELRIRCWIDRIWITKIYRPELIKLKSSNFFLKLIYGKWLISGSSCSGSTLISTDCYCCRLQFSSYMIFNSEIFPSDLPLPYTSGYLDNPYWVQLYKVMTGYFWLSCNILFQPSNSDIRYLDIPVPIQP